MKIFDLAQQSKPVWMCLKVEWWMNDNLYCNLLCCYRTSNKCNTSSIAPLQKLHLDQSTRSLVTVWNHFTSIDWPGATFESIILVKVKKFCFILIRIRSFDMGVLFHGNLIERIKRSLFECLLSKFGLRWIKEHADSRVSFFFKITFW